MSESQYGYKKFKLQSLVSTTYISNPNIYIMQEVIDNKDNLNIGITGSYGSGKSSFIKSYAEKFNKKLLYISLAILNETENNKLQNENTDSSKLEERLERAIVNQIVHQINPSIIPQSFLKSKKEKNYYFITFFIFFGLLLLSLIIPKSYAYLTTISSNILFLNLLKIAKTIAYFGIVIYGFFLLYNLLKKFNFSSVIKLKSELYEIEANSNQKGNDNESYFDRYLDDILYCISQSGCDAIVFEDIDRFKNQEIFIKLKEINNLVNNRHLFDKVPFLKRRKINKNIKKIPFIYALNDDLFESVNKTKFFDIVIPVMPYINGDNSKGQFDELFKDIKIKPDDKVLDILSYYVTDMRLLKNIYNEYMMYVMSHNENSNFQQHDYNQLFSLIVYKNLYPTDFSDLQYRKGDLYNIINSRKNIIKKQEDIINEQINLIDEEIKKVENEHLKDINELQVLFLRLPKNIQTSPNVPLIQFYRDYNIEEDYVKSNPEYMEREQFLIKGKENKLRELRNNQNNLNYQLKNLFITKFSNIITSDIEIKKFAYNKDLDDNQAQFIRTLLVNDFVNEDYRRYISYFHKGIASDIDINFLKNVNAKQNPNFDIELENIEWILKKINPETLDNNYAILNYSLLYYIIKNEESEIYDSILSLLENYKDKYVFIIFFYKYCIENGVIINKDLLNDLYRNNQKMVRDIFLNNTTIVEEKYVDIYYYIVSNSMLSKIDNIYYLEDDEIKNYIFEFVSSNHKILTTEYILKDDVWEYLKKFNIKFQNLNYIDKENIAHRKMENFLSFVFQNDLYKVNKNNINYLVENYFLLQESETNQNKSNYEIYLHNLSNKFYIANEFVKFLNIERNDSIILQYTEDINNIIINNEDISVDEIISFLDKYDIIVEDINKVRNDIWNGLFEYSLIKPVWNNIIVYYNSYKVDTTQRSTIISHIIEFLINKPMEDKLNTNENKELSRVILQHDIDDIGEEIYTNIIRTFEQIEKIPDYTIVEKNMKCLLKNNIFATTKENLAICFNKYKSNFHYFILNDIQLYVDNINSYVLSKEQLEYIVNRDSIDNTVLYNIVYYYFSKDSFSGYRDIKIANTDLLEMIFERELNINVKNAVFKSNIDSILKSKVLFFNSLRYILNNDIYGKVMKLSKQNSIRFDKAQNNSLNGILELLISKNVFVKRELSEYIEISVSDEYLEYFQKN